MHAGGNEYKPPGTHTNRVSRPELKLRVIVNAHLKLSTSASSTRNRGTRVVLANKRWTWKEQLSSLRFFSERTN